MVQVIGKMGNDIRGNVTQDYWHRGMTSGQRQTSDIGFGETLRGNDIGMIGIDKRGKTIKAEFQG